MGNRLVLAALTTLLVILHAQLWFGRGSLPAVTRMTQQLAEQQLSNQNAKLANERLDAEVKDLKEGLEIIEEKARHELGMVKPNEIYVQINK
jgi:cell division protein FtsB